MCANRAVFGCIPWAVESKAKVREAGVATVCYDEVCNFQPGRAQRRVVQLGNCSCREVRDYLGQDLVAIRISLVIDCYLLYGTD
jgi:hypothetical protein